MTTADTFPATTTTRYPVTGKPSRYFRDAGYARLARVEVERFFDVYTGRVEFAHIIAVDTEGNVWVSDARCGETEHDVASRLAARGYTTNRECLY